MTGNGDMDYSFIVPHDTILDSQKGNDSVCSSCPSTYLLADLSTRLPRPTCRLVNATGINRT